MSNSILTIELNKCFLLADQLLQKYVSNNIFDDEDRKLYKQLVVKKKTFGEALFLIPAHVIDDIDVNGTLTDFEKKGLLLQLETINLATFVFNIFNNNEYEMCINNFFQSVTNSSQELTEKEIDFYINSRAMWLTQSLKQNQDDLQDLLQECFPLGYSSLYFIPGDIDFRVVTAVQDKRKNFESQSKEEIIATQQSFLEYTKELQDFIRNRYGNILSERKISSKRIAEEQLQQEAKRAKSIFDAAANARKLNKSEIFDELDDSDNDTDIDELVDAPEPVEEGSPTQGSPVLEESPEDLPVVEDLAEDPFVIEELRKDYADEEYVPDDTAASDNDVYQLAEVSPEPEASHSEINEEDEIDSDSDSGILSVSISRQIIMPKPVKERAPVQTPAEARAEARAIPPTPKVYKSKIRKQPVPWTQDEIDALEAGLLRYRTSDWANIRKSSDILHSRTNVNLKDKARTEIKKLNKLGYYQPSQLGAYRFVHYPDP